MILSVGSANITVTELTAINNVIVVILCEYHCEWHLAQSFTKPGNFVMFSFQQKFQNVIYELFLFTTEVSFYLLNFPWCAINYSFQINRTLTCLQLGLDKLKPCCMQRTWDQECQQLNMVLSLTVMIEDKSQFPSLSASLYSHF